MGHQPVYVLADEQVRVVLPEETATHPFVGAESLADRLNLRLLTIRLRKYVLVGLYVPISNRFPLWCAGDETRERKLHV